MFGLFGKKASPVVSGDRQLTKNYDMVLKVLKKQRVEHCQANGIPLSQMGKDLAHIERKAKNFYDLAVKGLRDGKNHAAIYEDLLNNHATSETERIIVNKLFVSKK